MERVVALLDILSLAGTGRLGNLLGEEGHELGIAVCGAILSALVSVCEAAAHVRGAVANVLLVNREYADSSISLHSSTAGLLSLRRIYTGAHGVSGLCRRAVRVDGRRTPM